MEYWSNVNLINPQRKAYIQRPTLCLHYLILHPYMFAPYEFGERKLQLRLGHSCIFDVLNIVHIRKESKKYKKESQG